LCHVGAACGTEGGGRVVVGKLTERDRLEVRGLDGRKTLNWVLKGMRSRKTEQLLHAELMFHIAHYVRSLVHVFSHIATSNAVSTVGTVGRHVIKLPTPCILGGRVP
jgi:hypothetical protein